MGDLEPRAARARAEHGHRRQPGGRDDRRLYPLRVGAEHARLRGSRRRAGGTRPRVQVQEGPVAHGALLLTIPMIGKNVADDHLHSITAKKYSYSVVAMMKQREYIF